MLEPLDSHGSCHPWRAAPSATTNQFLLITGAVKETLVIFGRVPFAFYVAHFHLIHTLSVILGNLQGFSVGQMMTGFLFYPKGYGVGLTGVYFVWMLVIVILYPYCRWVAAVKARCRDWWLNYYL